MLYQNRKTKEWVWVTSIRGAKCNFDFLRDNLDGSRTEAKACQNTDRFMDEHRIVLADKIEQIRWVVNSKFEKERNPL